MNQTGRDDNRRAAACRDHLMPGAGRRIATLYEHCQARQVVHPNGGLREQPRGARELAILDPDRNAATFFEESWQPATGRP